jgi:hypothetical protein
MSGCKTRCRGTGARRDNRVVQARMVGPVSVPNIVPGNIGARGSTSGGYMGAGSGQWANNY